MANASELGDAWPMATRLLLAWLHLLALSIGLAGVWSRARALRATRLSPSDTTALRRAFTGDAWPRRPPQNPPPVAGSNSPT